MSLFMSYFLRSVPSKYTLLFQGQREVVPKHGVLVGGKCQESGYLSPQAFNLTLRVSKSVRGRQPEVEFFSFNLF